MNPWLALLSALIGYLFGSISSARLVTGRVAPGTNISHVEEPVPNSDQKFIMESVSATNVRVRVGTRYGCLTAILDMLKVALPTLVLRLLFPDQPYYLIAAALGLLGHDYPIYYRFKGGRGESAIYGGLLVIDPIGLVINNLGAVALGWLTGQLLVFRWAALILFIPWMWFTTHDPWHLAYILFANLLYWTSMIPELSQFFNLLKIGPAPTQEEIDQFLGMGGKLGRFMDRYSLPGLIGRLRKKSNQEKGV
jgi:glycerol-3-phosphate acyltransferase PlsY